MFTKSRKDKFVEQAQDLAHDLSEAIAPHVEKAKEELGPRISDARDQVAPLLADARDQVAPRVESARDAFVNDIVPYVQQAVSDARDQAAPLAEEAQRRGENAVAALKGEPVKRKGRKRKILLFAGLAGLAALAVQKLRGGESANWQTSYSPTPAPTPPVPNSPPSPAAPMSGSHVAEVPADSAADVTEEPHPVTTPDSPAEDVELTQGKKPKKS